MVIAKDEVYGAVIVAVHCHCESSPGSFDECSTQRIPCIPLSTASVALTSTIIFMPEYVIRDTDLAAPPCLVLQPGTRYQQLYNTYPHHLHVSAVVLKLNYLTGPMALTYSVARSCMALA